MLIDLSVVYRSDFQTNEKKIMGELDDLAKSAGAKKRKGDMNSAVEGTEEIRAWVSNTIKKSSDTPQDQLAVGESLGVIFRSIKR